MARLPANRCAICAVLCAKSEVYFKYSSHRKVIGCLALGNDAVHSHLECLVRRIRDEINSPVWVIYRDCKVARVAGASEVLVECANHLASRHGVEVAGDDDRERNITQKSGDRLHLQIAICGVALRIEMGAGEEKLFTC